MLGTKSGLTVAAIAQELGVSERTIRNDIRQLNEDLGDGASIEGVQGRYSLRIFDPDAYKKAYEKICDTDGMFDTPRGRQNYIFAELMRADAPLLTDELAYEGGRPWSATSKSSARSWIPSDSRSSARPARA